MGKHSVKEAEAGGCAVATGGKADVVSGAAGDAPGGAAGAAGGGPDSVFLTLVRRIRFGLEVAAASGSS
jgi:hypothetical protein